MQVTDAMKMATKKEASRSYFERRVRSIERNRQG